MTALFLEPPGMLTLRERPVPVVDGECLIRVRLAGICGTDLQMLDGYAGFRGIPGHEFVGVVERAPAADARWIGRRVAGEINVGCGTCAFCTAGIKEHCPARTVLGIVNRNGAFAEYLTLPAANLHEIPDAVDDEAAVFVEPLAAACRILDQVPIDAGTRVAVIGDGRLGLLIGQVLATMSDDLVLFGRHVEKLAVARALGLAARESDDGQPGGFDVVVDATGRPGGLTRALALVRPRGTVVMKSTFHGEAPLSSWPVVVHEVTLVGSRCGPFLRAIELLASGAVAVAPLVSAVARLDQFAPAFEQARRGLKVLLNTEPGSVLRRT